MTHTGLRNGSETEVLYLSIRLVPFPLISFYGFIYGTVNKRIRGFALFLGMLLNALLVSLGDAELDFISFFELILLVRSRS